ncbi:PREDICTED: death-associated protein kinase related isoform X2 [Rhagoletis zephyria]|uniref:death-associated protein kinase related isoform X1 n=1 Tax=Rhagoletis zephyria TaxID=28612 RepID=UPI0008116BCD|nr:PREDICTED: death-associated protein kinase related isoform X1 [Rhagoletis zephyria]XP_017465962.1 PREDICTED: death-associated protein kinase related isoform X2 [Rhagoletis zephyria]XP_017465963.1 PREDICTED: death-associated protein kinase related isoform X2 [Rhagoletis zephyria]XP_017465964.1 PREDICTED: death-associated protein kinase related isoform X2 [Rhagoletis zephyria]
MFTEGIFPIGDGLLDINEERLKELLVAEDINEIYELEQTPFARGKFAAVRRAIHKNSGVHFAAKFLKRRRRAQSSDKEIKHEIAVLMLCDGADNIVKLNAVHESRSDTALLLELATGGELQTFLDNEECLSEAHARYCMREVLKALQFLHKRSIAHLDLKPQNILLTGERIEDGLKLCDFGISRVVAEGTNVREIVGTPDYVAPEVLQYEPLSLLTDIWSVGVLAYVLLSGFSPFGGETKQETFLNISQCALTFPDKLFGGVSAVAIDFIRRALRIKPNDRMTAAGCLEHIWLKDECSIDRQILTDITKPTTVDSATAAADDEDEDDVCDDDDEEEVDEDEEEDEDEVGADEVENENEMSHDDGEDEQVNISIDADQLNGTNGSKMESSDTEEVEEEAQPSKPAPAVITNGQATYKNSNSSNGYGKYNGRSASNANSTSNGARFNSTTNAGSAGRYSNGTKSVSNGSTTTTTQRTTAIVTVQAMRATTIPLQYNSSLQHRQYQHHQQPQQQLQKPHQQHLQIPARRQSSSDSNKENTYLATKKITPATAGIGSVVVKKPLSATSTATIMIAGSDVGTSTTTAGAVAAAANVVATFTLPSGGYGGNSSQINVNSNNANNEKYISTTTATHCLFPDAPTTPKVIRKAPNAEASPTSVKALVKKFQLEGGNTSPSSLEKHALTHLKEAQSTNQQPQHANTTSPQMNGASSDSNSSKKSSPMSNGIAKKSDSMRKYVDKSGIGSAITNGRRASEPTTTVKHVTVAHTRCGSMPTSYKSTCVLCISYGGSKTPATTASMNGTAANGCRHSMDGAGGKHTKACNGNSTNKASNNIAANKSNKMSNSNTNATTTATATATAIVNGSNSSTTSTTTTAALLLGNHQQQQHLHNHHHHNVNGVHHHPHSQPHPHHHHHHHHHMHVAAKSAAGNNLSLDQGIIC